jgi:DnaJ-class molecular chaperone
MEIVKRGWTAAAIGSTRTPKSKRRMTVKTKSPEGKQFLKNRGERLCSRCHGEGFHIIFYPRKKKRPCACCDGTGSFPEFTAEDKKNFQHACSSTWQSIAADIPDAENMPLTRAVTG